MKVFVVLSAVLVCATSQVFYTGYPGWPLGLGVPAYTPLVRALPAPIITVPTSSQYHAQDELGQFTFGTSGDNQARVESKSLDGTVTGAYSYVDPTGKLVHVNYLADHNGFRVLGANNLPVAPEVPAVPELKGPEPVKDTAEVVAARAEFQKAFAEAKTTADAAPEEAKVEVETSSRRKRQAVLLSSYLTPTLAKSTLKYKQWETTDAKTPADTKAIELQDKETEVLTPALARVQVETPIVHTPLVYSHYQIPTLGHQLVYL